MTAESTGILDPRPGVCERIRDSKTIIVIIVFFSLLSDSMLLTLVGKCKLTHELLVNFLIQYFDDSGAC